MLHASIRHQQPYDELFEVIKEAPPISSQKRIDIYRRAYQIRLSECLREDFTDTCQKMGEVAFEKIIQMYIDEIPPKTSQLAEYSEGFVEYLKNGSGDIYETAAKEWMVILSQRAQEPLYKLTSDQIQMGEPYLIQLHPATQMKKLVRTTLVSYRLNEEIFFLDVEASESHWIAYFREPRSLDDLKGLIGKGEISEEELMNLLFQWMKKEIIYCLPPFAKQNDFYRF